MRSIASIFRERTTAHAVHATAARANARMDVDDAIASILLASPAPGETTSVAFHTKEHALARMFESLAPVAARALRRRLLDASDPIAGLFARMVVARQRRLIAILVDAPRRAAIAEAQGLR